MVTTGMDRICSSVSNLEDSLAFYRDWMGMKVVAEQVLGPGNIQQLWNLPAGTEARAVFLKNELQRTLLELIEFTPNSGRTIREGTKPWDHGIYCITFLVKDVDNIYRDLTEKGFTFASPPIQYQPNWVPHQLKEVTVIGPDNVRIDHFQRMKSEEYEFQGNYVRFDHCAQTVDNLEEAMKFYGDILGLDLRAEMAVPEGLVDDILGLPPGVRLKLAFFHKKDEDSLMMEIDQYSVKGKSLASVARPPNLGLFMTSFEVDNLSSLVEICKKEGMAILSGPVELHTKVHGKVRAITMEGPGGVMIELFER